MATGIQVFAPDGRLKLDTNTRITRVLGRVVLPITTTFIEGNYYVDEKFHSDGALAGPGNSFAYIMSDQSVTGLMRGCQCSFVNPTTILAIPAAWPNRKHEPSLGGSFMVVIYGKY